MGRAATASAAAEIAHGAAEDRSSAGGKQDLVDCTHESIVFTHLSRGRSGDPVVDGFSNTPELDLTRMSLLVRDLVYSTD